MITRMSPRQGSAALSPDMLTSGGNRRFDSLSSMCGNAFGIENGRGHRRRGSGFAPKSIDHLARWPLSGPGLLAIASCAIL